MSALPNLLDLFQEDQGKLVGILGSSWELLQKNGNFVAVHHQEADDPFGESLMIAGNLGAIVTLHIVQMQLLHLALAAPNYHTEKS